MSKTRDNFTFKTLNKKIIIVIILLCGVFFFSQIYIMSHVGTKSSEIDQIRKEKDDVRRDNEILTAEIDKEKSIASFRDEIDELGLTEKYVQEIQEKQDDNLAVISD